VWQTVAGIVAKARLSQASKVEEEAEQEEESEKEAGECRI
jgi:hypothetical protein